MKTYVSNVVEQPNQKGVKFYLDRKRALRVFDALIARLAQKGVPYNYAHVPQASQFRPSNLTDDLETAIYYFIGCLWMRGGTESDTALSFLKILHEKRRGLFEPSRWRGGAAETKKQVSEMRRILKKFKLPRYKENSVGWVYNMRKLDRFWSGDPRLLLNDKPTFKVLAKRFIGKGRTTNKKGAFVNEDNPCGFRYFRKKMSAMIAYFFMDAKLVDMFYCPAPVDVHFMRVNVANLILRASGYNPKEAIGINFYKESAQDLVRTITEWYCRKRKVSPIALCDAIWLLSRTLCRGNPGNSGYVIDLKREKAARGKKHRGQNEFLYSQPETNGENGEDESVPPEELEGRKRYLGLKSTEKELMTPRKVSSFEKSCGYCAIQSTCVYNISSNFYYVGGKLVPERFRVIPPDHQENFLGHSDFIPAITTRIDQTVRFAEIHFDPDE